MNCGAHPSLPPFLGCIVLFTIVFVLLPFFLLIVAVIWRMWRNRK